MIEVVAGPAARPHSYTLRWSTAESHSTTLTPGEFAELLCVDEAELTGMDLNPGRSDMGRIEDWLTDIEGSDTSDGVDREVEEITADS